MSKGDSHYYQYIDQNHKLGLISQNSSSKYKGGLSKNNKMWKDSRGCPIGFTRIKLRTYDERSTDIPKIIGIIYEFEE